MFEPPCAAASRDEQWMSRQCTAGGTSEGGQEDASGSRADRAGAPVLRGWSAHACPSSGCPGPGGTSAARGRMGCQTTCGGDGDGAAAGWAFLQSKWRLLKGRSIEDFLEGTQARSLSRLLVVVDHNHVGGPGPVVPVHKQRGLCAQGWGVVGTQRVACIRIAANRVGEAAWPVAVAAASAGAVAHQRAS